MARPTLDRKHHRTVPPATGSTDDTGGEPESYDAVLSRQPQRNLTKHELLRLAVQVASRPDWWRHHLAFSDTKRHYVSLHRDAYIDVWLLCWTADNDTGWHDHDISSGTVAVAQGALVEHNLAIGRPSLETVVRAPDAFCFDSDHIHRLTGYEPQSVSVHAYSPPLWRMGQYAITASGVLRRISVSYADELRPL